MSGCRGVVRPYKVPAASRIPMNFVQVCSCSGSRHTVAMSTHAHTHAHVRAHTHTHTKRGEPTLSVQVRREIIVAHTGTAGYREKNLVSKLSPSACIACSILKAICAGVGFGSGTKTTLYLECTCNVGTHSIHTSDVQHLRVQL